MIGFVLTINDKNTQDLVEYVDAIYCDDHKDQWIEWLDECIDIINSNDFNKRGVFICRNDYWVTEEGKDFNDLLSKTQINSLDEFIDYWNVNVKKMIEEIVKDNGEQK